MATTKSAKSSKRTARASARIARTAKGRFASKTTSAEKLAEVSNFEKTETAANQKAAQKSAEALAMTAELTAKTKKNAAKATKTAVSKSVSTKADAKTASGSSKTQNAILHSKNSTRGKVIVMTNMEIPTAVREVAEKTVEQARANYDKFKNTAEEATSLLEDSMETSRKGIVDLNVKVLDAAKVNTDATLEFFKDMTSVNSVSEAVELQTVFARKQYETVVSQGKDFQETATKLLNEVASPAKDAMDKAFSELKVA